MKDTIWFNGLSGSGKTTIGKKLVEHLEQQNKSISTRWRCSS
ncbi:MAG: adenylyl-sulfate kinase [Candidatus Saccharibacteria bacterium]|nr:adenylyl-sulfate kinase [Candidatus Saccharibacteria bacterium]